MPTKFVRYTCTKKKHSVLRKDCEKCSEYRPCAQDGKWCFIGALLVQKEQIQESIIQRAAISPIERISKDNATVTIFLGNGRYESAAVFREDFKAALKKQMQKAFGPQFMGGK